ncbi:hypothetical protein JYU14_05465 [Simkania negevensis]|uniref:Helicase XPB/Ssl2 N-terminal domain-containing protein n=1 Tax=Simkania negevensis TaxID=83561 RepID=A0ABS3AT04_9BACT|nr:hypothetical protein [Simkania negevensis]
MPKIIPQRKNKVNLEDYNYERDIKNRLLMSTFSAFDVEVLQEIIIGSIRVFLDQLVDDLDCQREPLLSTIAKLEQTGLFVKKGDVLHIDKEMRKYYEFQIKKFDNDFKPGMEFLQGLLRKVPIHILPIWYPIPKTTNNIFDSIVEKYLATPRIYKNYWLELGCTDPVFNGMVEEIFDSPTLKVFASDLRDKHALSAEAFEEYLLHLEFNFIACLSYNRIGDEWKEVVTPFYEWQQYLGFLVQTDLVDAAFLTPPSSLRKGRYSFATDATVVAEAAKEHPIAVSYITSLRRHVPSNDAVALLLSKCDNIPANATDDFDRYSDYYSHLLTKLCQVRVLQESGEMLVPGPELDEWLSLSVDERALFIYRHPYNKLLDKEFPSTLYTDRNTREAEKSLRRVLDKGWVLFDEFIKGVVTPLGENQVKLKCQGRQWKYLIPCYTDEEIKFIEAVVFQRLYEGGFVETGSYQGKKCFQVTAEGREALGHHTSHY